MDAFMEKRRQYMRRYMAAYRASSKNARVNENRAQRAAKGLQAATLPASYKTAPLAWWDSLVAVAWCRVPHVAVAVGTSTTYVASDS